MKNLECIVIPEWGKSVGRTLHHKQWFYSSSHLAIILDTVSRNTLYQEKLLSCDLQEQRKCVKEEKA